MDSLKWHATCGCQISARKRKKRMITVSGKKLAWREGMTIADLLDDLGDSHPYAVVRINETYVTRPNFEKATVPDNSEVFLIPMVAGG